LHHYLTVIYRARFHFTHNARDHDSRGIRRRRSSALAGFAGTRPDRRRSGTLSAAEINAVAPARAGARVTPSELTVEVDRIKREARVDAAGRDLAVYEDRERQRRHQKAQVEAAREERRGGGGKTVRKDRVTKTRAQKSRTLRSVKSTHRMSAAMARHKERTAGEDGEGGRTSPPVTKSKKRRGKAKRRRPSSKKGKRRRKKSSRRRKEEGEAEEGGRPRTSSEDTVELAAIDELL